MVPTRVRPAKAAQLEHFDKEALQASQVRLAEITDGAEVGNVLTDNDPASNVGVAASTIFRDERVPVA